MAKEDRVQADLPRSLNTLLTQPLSQSPSYSQVMSPAPQQATVLQAWVQHPHLGRGPPVLEIGSQLGRHSGMNPRCCRSGLARKAEAAGHIHPHLLHTPSHGSQPGKHSGKSRAGFRRPHGHRGLGSGCIHPHLHGASKSSDVRCDSHPPPYHATFCLSFILTLVDSCNFCLLGPHELGYICLL